MATYTTAQRDALANAIATGVTNVSYEGKNVTYRDLNEMRLLLDIINRDLNGTPAKRRFTPNTFKHL